MRFHVLVVDDSEEFLVTTAAVLSIDFDVTTAPSAEDALALDLGSFDVICSDYRMGEMNGLDFIMRARGLHSHVGLLLMTGLGDLDGLDKQLIENVGAMFVRKGFDPEFLITMVGTLAQTARLKGLNDATS